MDYSKLLLEQSPDAVVATTAEGIVLYWNGGAETLFGYTSSEALGRPLDDIVVPPDH